MDNDHIHNPAQKFLLAITSKAAQSVEAGVHEFQKHMCQALPFAHVADIKPSEPNPLQRFTLSIPSLASFTRPKTATANSTSTTTSIPAAPKSKRRQPKVHDHDHRTVCIELTNGKRRLYKRIEPDAEEDSTSKDKNGSKTNRKSKSTKLASSHSGFEIADDEVTHHKRVRDAMADYLLPQGFPDSVAPNYTLYMGWRGVQYFFGGAMSVFTTKSLLGALGVANRHSGEAAAAINWVVKDGAGRLGRFLFARWGRSLDCELKQFRLAGDFLMESGAALELSTILAPRMFLPLACTANLAKNLAAVAASSTRAPIYRNFARQNNLADITAKGESVANLADIMGTAFGIVLTKGNFPIVTTFCILSCGYLLASRKEVDSVELPYLNRARLSYAARKFLDTGVLPGPVEANRKEALLPWNDKASAKVVLGASVQEACTGPDHLEDTLEAFKSKKYAITYRDDTRKVYVLLKQHAQSQDVLQAALDAHAVIYMLERSKKFKKDSGSVGGVSKEANGAGRCISRFHRAADTAGYSSNGSNNDISSYNEGRQPHEDIVKFVAKNGKELYKTFETVANKGGWKIPLTMLNPLDSRLAV